ncbi:caspase, EACC1-associated type [Nocardia jejuensis]|uniref:caspase, EACC1-associated type n=1 Tax=Nocardia jejuensis TaxID=328049 RepID=UPI000832E7D7|nr:tetratricopeptide repeat protein [Nocardia jejuensis]
MTESLDRNRFRAVLIGTSRYTHPDIPPIPSVVSNLTDLARLLTTPDGAGLRSEHCALVAEPDHSTQIGTVLARAAGEAEDVLLVYYTGHGMLDRRGRLHLALTGSDPNQVGWTATPFTMLREEIVESPARARILILDCCFSGRAFEAMGDGPAVVAGQVDIHGTYTIVSSAANETSFAPAKQRNTAFTAALLAAATVPGLTLDELYRRIDRDLLRCGHPRPQRRSVDIAGDIRLFRGRVAASPSTVGAIDRTQVQQPRSGAHGPATPPSRSPRDAETRTGSPASGIDAFDSAATFRRGLALYAQGEYREAAACYLRAAQDGNMDAAKHLAASLDTQGKYEEAESWYRRAAQTGHVDSMGGLGRLLHDREKLDEAESWYRRAADLDDTEAMFNLGLLLLETRRYDEADALHIRAADGGNVRAMNFLAECHADAGGLDKAEHWFRRSAARGDRDGIRGLEELDNRRDVLGGRDAN